MKTSKGGLTAAERVLAIAIPVAAVAFMAIIVVGYVAILAKYMGA